MKQKPNTIDQYIETFPEDLQQVLKKIHQTIMENAAMATEGISYGMPSYKTNKKPLVYFAAYPKHIGFYATPSGHEKFMEKLSRYKQGKGSVQFPLDEPIPYRLIAEIVQFRVSENEGK